MEQKLYPWFFLDYGGSDIKREILANWTELLEDRSQPEETYHKFISNFSRFFFNCEREREYVIVSKLRLGADFTTDLIFGIDYRSAGFQYKLIELESPHDIVYTNAGAPSAKLTNAIQQIQDWRNWISENADAVKKIFPRNYFLNINNYQSFEFQIIIGRRNENKKHERKRTQYSKDLGIDIRSYDYLTDILRHKTFPGFYDLSRSIMPMPEKIQINHFINPFAKAYTHAQWKEIIEHPRLYEYHMVASNIETLIKNRDLNEEYFTKFENLFNSQTDEVKKVYFDFLDKQMKNSFLYP